MAADDTPQWLEWARELQAIGQTGLAFTQSPYDTQRYQRLTELAAEIVAGHTTLEKADLVKGFSAQPGYATVKVDVRARSSGKARSCWFRNGGTSDGACPAAGPTWETSRPKW